MEGAIALAARMHAGQRDKADAPYILHPIRVMLRVESLEEKIAAVLHDVDSMDLSRLPDPQPEDHARLERYRRAHALLLASGASRSAR